MKHVFFNNSKHINTTDLPPEGYVNQDKKDFLDALLGATQCIEALYGKAVITGSPTAIDKLSKLAESKGYNSINDVKMFCGYHVEVNYYGNNNFYIFDREHLHEINDGKELHYWFCRY